MNDQGHFDQGFGGQAGQGRGQDRLRPKHEEQVGVQRQENQHGEEEEEE